MKKNRFFIRIYKIFLRFVGITGDKTSRHLFRLFQIATYIVLSLLLVDISSIYFGSERFGQFGDFFGGVANPILTFLTFMGLIMTIVIQKKELILTRKEMRASSDALRQQVINQDKQRFEDTFFSLLEQHNLLLDKIITYRSSPSGEADQDSVAISIRLQLIGGMNSFHDREGENLQKIKAKLLKTSPILNQYFRVLYQILKFIAFNCPSSTVKNKFSSASLRDKEISQEEKLYANIIRSFISEDVLYLLAINCFCDNENDHFIEYKALVERYSFFEHMRIKLPENYNLKIIDEIARYYSRNAFGKNTDM